MRKEIALGIVAVLLVTTPAFAAPGGKSNEAKDNHGMEVAAEKTAEHKSSERVTLPVIVTPTETQAEVESLQIEVTNSEIEIEDDDTPTPTPLKHGFGQLKKVEGAAITAEDCDPEAQWKNHGAYVSCIAKTHPGGAVVAEAARSDIGKKATPSATPTGEPATSPETEVTVATNPLDTFFKAIGRLLHSLPFLPHNA